MTTTRMRWRHLLWILATLLVAMPLIAKAEVEDLTGLTVEITETNLTIVGQHDVAGGFGNFMTWAGDHEEDLADVDTLTLEIDDADLDYFLKTLWAIKGEVMALLSGVNTVNVNVNGDITTDNLEDLANLDIEQVTGVNLHLNGNIDLSNISELPDNYALSVSGNGTITLPDTIDINDIETVKDYMNEKITADEGVTFTDESGTKVLTATEVGAYIPASQPNQPATPTTPSGGGWGGGSSLSADRCPNGDYSASYYDGDCGDVPPTALTEPSTTAQPLSSAVAAKVAKVQVVLNLIFMRSDAEKYKVPVYNLLQSVSLTHKDETMREVCKVLIENWEY